MPSVASVFDGLLKEPLYALDEQLRKSTGGTPLPVVCILVDALDELDPGRSRGELITVLQRLSELPSWIRFILTSRPDYDLLPDLDQLKPLRIEEDKRNRDDLELYIDSILKPKIPNDAMRWEGISMLMKQSGMLFVYVAQIAAAVRADSFKGTLEELASFPQGLDGVYRDFFSVDRMDLGTWKNAKPLLQVLLAMQVPPTLKEIAW